MPSHFTLEGVEVMSNSKKRFSVISIIAVILAMFLYQSFPEEPVDGISVTFVDVGQGDCAFIKTKAGETILVDGGEEEDADKRLETFLNLNQVETVDMVIATHYHSDHIGAMPKVFQNCEVKRLIVPDYEPKSKAKSRLLRLAKDEGALVSNVSEGDVLPSIDPDLKISALHPRRGGFSEEENNNSLVLKLEYFENTVLLTGDVEEEAERTITEKYDIETDILKVAHHGSVTSTCREFLQAANPTYAVVQCGKDNRYGHPHSETVAALEDDDVRIYRTDLDGDITFTLTKDGIKSVTATKF